MTNVWQGKFSCLRQGRNQLSVLGWWASIEISPQILFYHYNDQKGTPNPTTYCLKIALMVHKIALVLKKNCPLFLICPLFCTHFLLFYKNVLRFLQTFPPSLQTFPQILQKIPQFCKNFPQVPTLDTPWLRHWFARWWMAGRPYSLVGFDGLWFDRMSRGNRGEPLGTSLAGWLTGSELMTNQPIP